MKIAKNLTDRCVYYDVLKIISAFFIVFYHFGRLDFGTFSEGVYTPNVNRVITNITVLSIPIFFMVTGALIFNKNYSVEKVYTKAAKIALVIFIWTFTGFPSWFLKTLLIIYLVYPILIKIFENKKLCTLASVALFIFPYLYNEMYVLLIKFFPNFTFNILGKEITIDTLPGITGLFTMYSILYMFIGAYLSTHKTSIIFGIFATIAGIGLVTFDGTALSNYNSIIYDSVNGCFPTVGAMIASVGFFSIVKNINIKNEKIVKVTTFLGSRVLYTYLFHAMLINICRKYLLTQKHYNLLVMLLMSFLVFALSFLIGFILEKIPLVKNLVKI